MTQGIYKILSNRCVAKNTFEMVLEGDTSSLRLPGQFINILLDGCFLRRPISVCDYDSFHITIIYKVVGKGTALLSKLNEGTSLDILCGLGNGFDTAKSGFSPLLIGGGAGIPPMYALAKQLLIEKKKPIAILGFNTADEIFYREKFEALGMHVLLCTADGSIGIKGFVTDAIRNTSYLDYSFYYACGPEAMLKAIYHTCSTDGQMSFEERMGCGFGACMGCSCKTKYGNKRICKDGPVLNKEEILW